MFSTIIKSHNLQRFGHFGYQISTLSSFAMRLPQTINCIFAFAAFLLISQNTISAVVAIRCYSCFTACNSHKNCDCETGSCEANACFSRLIAYSGDNNYAIHKGCTDIDIGSSPHPCHIGLDDNASECYCDSEDFCNERKLLLSAKPANSSDCCEQTHEDDHSDTCPSLCQGYYCYDDQMALERGCGHGHSDILKLLRINSLGTLANRRVCAKLWYEDKNILQQGCVCQGVKCNDANQDSSRPKFSRSTVECHTCATTVDASGDTYDTCDQNKTCRGNFCYVMLRTEQFPQYEDEETEELGPPVREEVYSLQLGCANTDKAEAVKPGCNKEWSSGSERSGNRKLTNVECICDTPLCNVKSLIAESSIGLRIATSDHPKLSTDTKVRQHEDLETDDTDLFTTDPTLPTTSQANKGSLTFHYLFLVYAYFHAQLYVMLYS